MTLSYQHPSKMEAWYYTIDNRPQRSFGSRVQFFRKDLWDKFGQQGKYENLEDAVLDTLLPGAFESVSFTVFDTDLSKDEVRARLNALKWFEEMKPLGSAPRSGYYR
jgi:hypothetical protein